MFVCPVPKISQVMMKRRRRASHLGRFTLWHNGRRATQLGRFNYFVVQRPPKLLKDERFERFSKHRSIVDLSKRLRTRESPRELVRQSEAKRNKAASKRGKCVSTTTTNAISKKNLPSKWHREPNNAQNTQHKLEVAFAYLERH